MVGIAAADVVEAGGDAADASAPQTVPSHCTKVPLPPTAQMMIGVAAPQARELDGAAGIDGAEAIVRPTSSPRRRR